MPNCCGGNSGSEVGTNVSMFDVRKHRTTSWVLHDTRDSLGVRPASPPARRERSQDTYLVCLNLRNQIPKRGQAAQPHCRLGLLHRQTLDLGRRASVQDDLLPPQEVLEFGIVGGLPGKGATVSWGLSDSLLLSLKEQ